MSAKTKIFVFKMREVVYTAIFVVLAILLVVLLVFMFLPDKGTQTTPTNAAAYIPGTYTSSIMLNNQALDVEVSVDSNHINSIRFVNLNEAIATMYPLMESSMNSIQTQVLEKQSLESIDYANDTQYTSSTLLEAVQKALDKAER